MEMERKEVRPFTKHEHAGESHGNITAGMTRANKTASSVASMMLNSTMEK